MVRGTDGEGRSGRSETGTLEGPVESGETVESGRKWKVFS